MGNDTSGSTRYSDCNGIQQIQITDHLIIIRRSLIEKSDRKLLLDIVNPPIYKLSYMDLFSIKFHVVLLSNCSYINGKVILFASITIHPHFPKLSSQGPRSLQSFFVICNTVSPLCCCCIYENPLS